MMWIFQRFFFPNLLCDFLRIQCAACSGFAVRHRPDSVCDMLRIMHTGGRRTYRRAAQLVLSLSKHLGEDLY